MPAMVRPDKSAPFIETNVNPIRSSAENVMNKTTKA
jgi:hypothetical protein